MTAIKKRVLTALPYSVILIVALILIGLVASHQQTVSAQSTITRVITDPVGNQATWDYQYNLGRYQVVSKTSAVDGKSEIYQYDAANNLISKTDAEGKETTYTYNPYHQKTTMTEAAGTPQARTTSYTYYSPDIDLITQVSEPSVYASGTRETLTTYDSHLNPIAVTLNGFKPDGTPLSRTTHYTYNNRGQVIQIDGPRTDVSDMTTFTYNDCTTGGGCGQLASVTNALGHLTTYDQYDAGGLLLQSTDPNGATTNYSYDNRNRVSEITVYPLSGDTRITTYTYDPVGQVIQVHLPDGLVMTNTYNAAHYLTAVEDNQGNRIEYGYDLKGNRIQTQTKDPSGILEHSITTAYDHRDQIIEINTGGSITQMVKDAVGNLTAQTDPNDHPASHSHYDALDRLNQYIDALGGQTDYDYNHQDQLIQVTAPNGAATQYQYDDLGHRLSETGPDRGHIRYTYDEAGNMISQTDARGITATYQYDELNRLLVIDYPGTDEDIYYQYDTCINGMGRLCQITDQSGITDYEYNGYGSIVTHSKMELNNTYITDYEYDKADRIIKMTYPSGREVDYYRNVIGRVERISATGVANDLVYNRRYRADGQVKEQYWGNGLIETRAYDSQGRLTRQVIGEVETIDYDYDANGNVITLERITDPNNNNSTRHWGYDYDALDRLMGDLKGNPEDHTDDYRYTYDGNGNRVTENTTTYTTTTNSNQLSHIENALITYDAAGNRLTGPDNQSYVYNLAGRLREYQENDQTEAVYTYNAQGQRTRKVEGNKTTLYHYDLSGLLISEQVMGAEGNSEEGNSNENTDAYDVDYIWLEGEPIAQISDGEEEDIEAVLPEEEEAVESGEPIPYTPPTAEQIAAAKKVLPIIYMLLLGDEEEATEPTPEPDPTPSPEPEDKVRFIHGDHLRTPRLATDNGQTMVWRWEGHAFGATAPNEDPDNDGNHVTINLRYPGQYFDSESNLHYNWNRYYDPSLGRYLTSDPIGLDGGINTYLYAMANPVKYVDSTGLVCTGAPDSGFGFNFSSCCQSHDNCYGCKGEVENKSRADCDDDFCQCTMDSCKNKPFLQTLTCMRRAKQYCDAVRIFGQYFFNKGREGCPNCP